MSAVSPNTSDVPTLPEDRSFPPTILIAEKRAHCNWSRNPSSSLIMHMFHKRVSGFTLR
jgi:hypothetical protein